MAPKTRKKTEREQGDRPGYGTQGYGIKDTGQVTKIPINPKTGIDVASAVGEAVAVSPQMGDGSGVPVSKRQLQKEKDEDMQIRRKLGLAESMNE